MEQWVANGRTIIEDRGHSILPQRLESEGYSLDLTGMRGILKKVLKEGEGETPLMYATCQCHYTYTDVDGDVVDESEKDFPLDVVVGAGQVTQGFDEGLLTMRQGEEAELWLDPAFAFRENGMRGSVAGRAIQPDAPVLLRIHLISFDNPMNDEETLLKVDCLKALGNEAVQSEQWEVALRHYHNALRLVTTASSSVAGSGVPNYKQKRAEVSSVLCSNIALVWFQRNEMNITLQFVTRALRYNPRNAKALFRRALVQERRLEFHTALQTIEEMRSLGVGDAVALEEMVLRIQEKDTSQSGTQKQMYKKMF